MITLRVRRKFLLVAGGFLLAALIFAWVAPNLLRSRMEQSEQSAPQVIRQINEAVRGYIEKHGAAPPDLSAVGDIPYGWSCQGSTCDHIGYRFRYSVVSQNGGKPRYFLSAQPLQYGVTGVYSYFVDETDVLRCTKEPRSATSNDRPMSSCREDAKKH